MVADVYRSGWLSMGPATEAFEQSLAEYVGCAHAIAVTNGTAALHLIAMACGLGPGDEVVVPSLTFVATVNAIAYTGARPVFADVVSSASPLLSAADAENAITDRTRAVMHMTYGGHSGETQALRDLCARRGLLLLEDAAHGLGSRLGGRHVGTFGAAGALSFFSNKNLAVGEGGAVITDDADLAASVRLLRSHGMTSLSWDRHQGHATGYDVVALGYNYRIDEPRAALADARLTRLDAENARRGLLVDRYRDHLADAGVELPLAPVDGLVPAHHLFCAVLPAEVDRSAFRSALASAGVQTSMHYPPVHGFSIYAPGAPSLPVTEAYGRRAVTLPLFAHMTHAQQDHVIATVRAALG